jgi:photosystem II stability/assembly factor-like uncharacterized protein
MFMKRVLVFSSFLFISLMLCAQWEWQNPTPIGKNLRSVSTIDENDVWAISYDGYMIHFDGKSWHIINVVNEISFYDIKFYDHNHGFAVADNGLYVYENGKWAKDKNLMTTLFKICFISKSNIWISGEGGIIKHYDGQSWRDYNTGVNSYILGLDFVDDNYGWAVGNDGVILKWDGTNWKLQIKVTNYELNDVQFIDKKNGWAVGQYGLILQYDGSDWFPVESGTSSLLMSLHILNNKTGWACGASGTLLKFNGESWSSSNSNTYQDIWKMSFSSDSLAFAVGSTGFVSKFDGTGWVKQSSIVSEQWLNSLSFISSTDGWATGGNSVLHFDGKSWSTYPINDANFYCIDMIGSDDGWLVGSWGKIYNWNGTKWTLCPYIVHNDLLTVCFVNSQTGWASGIGGALLKYGKNGWSESFNTGNTIYSLAFTDENHGWAVGENGKIYFYNGSVWTEQNSGTTNILRSVFFLNESDGWITGDAGTILHWDGINWIKQESGSGATLNCIYFTGKNNGWIVGGYGILLHYDGSSWKFIQMESRYQYNSICFTDENNAWIGGIYGSIIHTASANTLSSIKSPVNADGLRFCNPYSYGQMIMVPEKMKNKILNIELFDLLGKLKYKASHYCIESFSIDNSSILPGNYILKVSYNNQEINGIINFR